MIQVIAKCHFQTKTDVTLREVDFQVIVTLKKCFVMGAYILYVKFDEGGL